MTDLQSKAIKSVKWTAIQIIIVGLSTPLLLVLKAKFLSPAEFAALAIITIFTGLYKTLVNLGVSQAIIQRNKLTVGETSSLFIFNILLTSLLGVCLFFLSPIAAFFFKIPELSYLLKITSIIVIINGPSMLIRAFLEKSLFFKELSLIDMINHLIMIVSTALLLYMGLGVLGVVLGQIISLSLSLLLLVIVSINKKVCKLIVYFKLREIISYLKFGTYVSGKQVLSYLTLHVDELIIGYFFTNEVLGVYHFSKNMLDQLRSLITASFGNVLFPVLTRLEGNPEKLSLAYSKISSVVAFFSFPVFIGISITAHIFVPLIFGEEWVSSVPFFQVFSLSLILMVLTSNISTSLLYSVGKPNIVLYIDIVTSLIYIVSLVVFASQGVFAVLFVYCCYIFYNTATLQYYACKELLFSFFDYIISFKNILIVSIFMALAVLLIQIPMTSLIGDLGQFTSSIITGIVVYLMGVLILERDTFYEIKFALLRKK